ncbi:hypothetical protein HID58_006846 [Brassica napus]|uniref:Uncharacterized protein n=1 Tax=Brassica napus TaxID=3708 RepID=A0ABQ8EFH5_BRANA|nr:hypothetical protein HID58_006846 [Brassica napus]
MFLINTTAKEVDAAEAEAKAAIAYTDEASKTLRGRNICKMMVYKVTEEEEECVAGEERERSLEVVYADDFLLGNSF